MNIFEYPIWSSCTVSLNDLLRWAQHIPGEAWQGLWTTMQKFEYQFCKALLITPTMAFTFFAFSLIWSENFSLSSMITPRSFPGVMCSSLVLYSSYSAAWSDLLLRLSTLYFSEWNGSSHVSAQCCSQDKSACLACLAWKLFHWISWCHWEIGTCRWGPHLEDCKCIEWTTLGPVHYHGGCH